MFKIKILILNLLLSSFIFAEPVYTTGGRNFTLVNPIQTRNIIGDYAIAGNTVECLTNSQTQFNQPCVSANLNMNDNNFMVKYIDIDSNPQTWNSTSSNFTIPPTAIDSDSIVWAGLFWQGNINNFSAAYSDGVNSNQRRAFLRNGSIRFINLPAGTFQNVNIRNTDADKVLLKIDNGAYTNVMADNVDIFKIYNATSWWWLRNIDAGGTYAAYADVTNILKNKHLSKGKHTVTVANITANEGKERSYGDFAGWSLVVIYKEGFEGKPRNISIYNGYEGIDSSSNPRTTLKIEGFRLPKDGNVSAQYSVFAGEGEWIYGARPNVSDTMTIGRTQNGPQDQMPDVNDSTNIF